jgi:hypothetical protein
MPENTHVIAQILSAILFAWFGMSALLSESMVTEFKRYGLARFRVLTGLVAGQYDRPILLISAGGLTAMMVLGVMTRVRIKDPLPAALPAFALGVLNLYIFAAAL